VAASASKPITGDDALGEGDVSIALMSFFPPPKPDLGKLPHGTAGDVVLDVVIDASGKIVKLQKTQGLGYGVDESVIATVQTWTFQPATRNGTPVPSEQELHFHFERG
jgi:protein TonB